MILFENIDQVHTYITNELVDKKRSHKDWVKKESWLYLPYSNKLFKTSDEIIADLVEYELLFELKEYQGWIREKESKGYVLFFSPLIKMLKGKNGSFDSKFEYERLLTVNDCCEFLNVSRPTVYKLIKNNVLQHVEIFGNKRIPLYSLLDYAQQGDGKPDHV
jgi:excisionase family DNA binding protein